MHNSSVPSAILASTSVLFRLTTVQMQNFALIYRNGIYVLLCKSSSSANLHVSLINLFCNLHVFLDVLVKQRITPPPPHIILSLRSFRSSFICEEDLDLIIWIYYFQKSDWKIASSDILSSHMFGILENSSFCWCKNCCDRITVCTCAHRSSFPFF